MNHYENVIDELNKYGIEPIITICHFDIPLALIEKYGSWKSREVIDCYLRYCEALFHRFGKKVRYWITFNEINMLMHLPFMGAGIRLEEDENPMEVKYQAAHHELVASALAVKMAHEICPGSQVGCILRRETSIRIAVIRKTYGQAWKRTEKITFLQTYK